jgi:ubiquinone biosynthesis accessory factor UbiJ
MNRLALPLAQFALSAINHVLQQQSAARERMRVHAGRQLRIVVTGPLGGSIHSDARIDRDGMLVLVSGGAPAAILTFSPSLDALFGILRAGAAGAGAHLKVEGDVMLAAAVGQVAQLLRWDFEEDLSGLVGDVVAHRIGRLARGFGEGARGLGSRSQEALQRAATAPGGPLATSVEMAEFTSELNRLAQAVAQLEDRVAFSRR